MGWRTVVITQHCKVSCSGHMMVVQTQSSIKQIPISDVQILLVSTTQAVITSAIISELAQQQTKVIFTDRTGNPITETVDYCPNNRNPDRISQQFNWSEDLKQKLWTDIIRQKILNQIKVITLTKQDPVHLTKELDSLCLGDTTNREAVVAQKYFSMLFDASFVRRSSDAINAALNYGYAILLSTVNREIVAAGYLTQLGIHHRSQENNYNLGSDFMEPFRPFVDYWVQQQNFNNLTPDVKYGLVDLLNIELTYNGQHMIMRNAITRYVQGCLKFLSQEIDQYEIEVTLDEVSSDAINGDV